MSGRGVPRGNRRLGAFGVVVLLLLVVGGLIGLVPTHVHYSQGTLVCGAPIWASLRSGHDYLTDAQADQARGESLASGAPQSDGTDSGSGSSSTIFTPASIAGIESAGDACVSDSRPRAIIGAAVMGIALICAVGVVVAAARRRTDA